MSPFPAAIAERIGRLIPRLASNYDGEVVATSRAIERTLEGAGLDLHVLAEHVTKPALPAAPRSRSTRRRPGAARTRSSGNTYWSELVARCQRNGKGHLGTWEVTFLESMSVWTARGAAPTERQAQTLRDLCRKFGAFS